jgi:hypothetical protein
MPRGSPLLHFIRGLNKDELQAISERCEWCNVRKTNVPAGDLSKRVRKSIKNNVEKDNISYEEAMQDIRDEVLIPGPDPLANKIRYHLRSTPAATHIGEVRIEEEWFSAQLYGALWASIKRPYTVKLERQLNTRNRPTTDIYVESEEDDGDYLIEVKRAPVDNGEAVREQLERYHRAMQEDLGRKRERTFLCVIGENVDLERKSGSRKSENLSEYLEGVPSTVDEISDDLPRTEVVSNTFQ